MTARRRILAAVLLVAAIPSDVSGTVSGIRRGLQAALSGRGTRLTIDLPAGARLGVAGEKESAPAPSKAAKMGGAAATAALERGDRELARLVVEMLLPLGPEATTVAFVRGARAADEAVATWKGAVKNPVIALGGAAAAAPRKAPRGDAAAALAAQRGGGIGGATKKNKKKKKKGGFAAQLAADMAPRPTAAAALPGDDEPAADARFDVPQNAEVLLVAGALGGTTELEAVRAACDERGDALTVVLLNARLEAYAARADADPALATYFDAFEPAFALVPALPPVVAAAASAAAEDDAAAAAAAPLPAERSGAENDDELVLHREFPGEWTLARRRKGVGGALAAKELRRFGTTRPTCTEVASSADASERDLLDKLGELKLPFSS